MNSTPLPVESQQINPTERQPHVLVVDDESLVCWALEKALNKIGCQISTVPTGEAAIEAMSASRFDLVITDMKLPHLDGFAVASEAKRRLPDTPVMMISAFGDSASRQKAEATSIEYFIDKPFDLAAMTSLVASILSCRPKRML